MDDLSGTIVKGYELQEQLGTGGFGAVYRACQVSVGREVAIKVILPRFSNNPDFIRRFEIEAQIIARLEHMHIAPLYDYWRDPDGTYLVMRYFRGGSLSDALRNGPYDLPSTALLLDQVAVALTVAHRNYVVHRDLKPGNILLDEDGNAYLADFGIAKDITQTGDGLTAANAIVGSLDYISPEQARSEPITPRTDIYSLGVVLYEMLKGEHPFPGISSVERLYKHLNDPLPEINTLDESVCEAIDDVIQTATAKDPAKRYQDALALAAAFREAARLKLTAAGENIVEQLTRREQDILRHIVAGLSNKDIARELFVELSTVKWHATQIYRKLGVRSRMQCIIRARELNLVVGGDGDSDLLTITSDSLSTGLLPQPENPYKGLRPFQPADTRDFFGREELTATLLSRMSETGELVRFLAVIGPSGSGKSSAVRAGLIPALWRGDLRGSEKWFIVDMLPGSHPLDELEIALMRIAADQARNLHEPLTRDPRGLLRAAQIILPDDGSELVVIVDQFEEVFMLVEDETERQCFLDLLYTAVAAPRSRVRVVITLRADFYDKPLHYAEFGELVRSRMETILPLSADELHRAISKPAEQVGVTFEEGLVATIVSEIHYQPGALPLLQYALTELFDNREGRRLTFGAYEHIGKTTGALSRRAEAIHDELDDAGREAARQMFMRLVTLGEGTEDTRRRIPRSELLAVATDPDVMEEVIDLYTTYRLLSLDHDPSTRLPMVEVAHEAILREWQRLRDWLGESRHDIRQQRLLAAATSDWRNAGQDASYLLHGTRLEQFDAWAAETRLALTQEERDFLETSISTQHQQEENERERQARELELARQSADLAQKAAESARQAETAQRRAANRLRYFVAGLVVFLLGAVILALVALNERDNAEAARNNERTARAQAEDSLRRTDAQRLGLETTSLVEAGGESDLIGLLAVTSVTADYTPQGDVAVQAAMLQQYPRQTLRLRPGEVSQFMSLSPDGTFLAVGTRSSSVQVWNLETGESVGVFDGGPEVRFFPDNRRLITLNVADGTLRVWNWHTGEQAYLVEGLQNYGRCSVIFPDGQTIAIAGQSGEVLLLNADTGTEIERFKAHDGMIYDMVVSPNGASLLTIGFDGMARLWDTQTWSEIRSFSQNSEVGTVVAFSPDGTLIATGSAFPRIRIWDSENAEVPLREFRAHTGLVTALAFSPDGQRLVSSGTDTTVRFWDIQSGQEIRQPLIHQAVVRDIQLSSDGQTLYTSSDSDVVRVWDIEPQFAFPRFASSSHHHGQAFSPDGTQLAKLLLNVFSIFDPQTGTELAHYEADALLDAVTFSPDGRYVAFGSRPGTVFLWNVHDQAIVQTYGGLKEITFDIAISPDNRTIASGDFNAELAVWELETGEVVFTITGDRPVTSLAFSPDGRLLLQTDWGGTAKLWDTQTWEVVWSLPLGYGFSDGAFSPDGRFFLIGGAGPMLSLWDVETLTLVHDFTGHHKPVMAVDFSSDGNLILSGSEDATARLWDAATGVELRRFDVPKGTGQQVLINPDGQILLVDDTEYAYLWYVRLQDSMDYLCQHITRELTDEERSIYEIRSDAPTCPASTE